MLVFFIVNLAKIIVIVFATDRLKCEPLLINYVLLDTILTVVSSLNLIIEEMASQTTEILIAFMILKRY
jgi:hypothetical protein